MVRDVSEKYNLDLDPDAVIEDLPVGAQLVTPMHTDALLLEVAESLEEVLCFDRSPVLKRWVHPPSRSGLLA